MTTTAKEDMPKSRDPRRTVAFQGVLGAYSDLACRVVYPDMVTLPCPSFEDAFAAAEEKRAELALIPIENSVAGRVAEIHQLLPHTGLHIVAEHFQRVNHHLLAPRGAPIDGLETVHSHVHARWRARSTGSGRCGPTSRTRSTTPRASWCWPASPSIPTPTGGWS
jgi:prephenate dehydratase